MCIFRGNAVILCDLDDIYDILKRSREGCPTSTATCLSWRLITSAIVANIIQTYKSCFNQINAIINKINTNMVREDATTTLNLFSTERH